jgi:putative MATE family efflux protein
MPNGRFFRLALDKEIFSLAWPVIISNLLQTITMFVDLIMVGQLGHEALAAVGLGGQVLFFIWAIVMGLSTGTIAIVARRSGEGAIDRADNVLKQSVILGVLISIPIALLGSLFGYQMLSVFGAEEQIVALGYEYISILFLASPAIFVFFIASSALRGVGDTKTPLYVSALLNLINFIMNYCLIFGNFGFPQLGVRGAALGTTIAFVISLLVYLLLLRRKNSRIHLKREGPYFTLDTIRSILHIGTPSALEQALIQFGFVVYIAFIVSFGTEALAAHNIGARIQSLAFMPGFGFAIATTTLVGQSLGSRDPDKAENSGWEGSKLSLITMTSTGLLMVILADPISRLFATDSTVLTLSNEWIVLLALATPAVGIHFTMAGGLQGAGDTRWPLYVSFIGLYMVRLPLAYFLGFMTPLGVQGVWLSMSLEYYVRAAIITNRFRKGKWKKISV